MTTVSVNALGYAQRDRLAYMELCLWFFGSVRWHDLAVRYGVQSAASRDLTLYQHIAPANMPSGQTDTAAFSEHSYPDLPGNTEGDAVDEDQIVNSATGIRDTVVWRKLYKLQRDGIVGAIDTLTRFGGCIIEGKETSGPPSCCQYRKQGIVSRTPAGYQPHLRN